MQIWCLQKGTQVACHGRCPAFTDPDPMAAESEEMRDLAEQMAD
jgi:hypothetical protein